MRKPAKVSSKSVPSPGSGAMSAEFSPNDREPAAPQLELAQETTKGQLGDTGEQAEAFTEKVETRRAELDSINEELMAVNLELTAKVDQLGQANSDLQNLMTAMDRAIVFLDRELRIMRFTSSAKELFNFIPTDLGRPLADLSRTLDYPEMVADATRVLVDLTPTQREVSAGDHCLLARTMPYRTTDDRIAGVVLTFTDITTMKQAESATSRLAAIVESSSDAIVGKDLRGVVTSWNAGAEEIFGYSASEMIGQPVARLIPAERQAEEVEILGRIAAGETIKSFETVRMRKDGSLISISVTISPIKDATGSIIGGSKIARDISETKRIQQALWESEEEFRSLAEVVPQVVWATRPDGWNIYFNQRWTDYTGLSLEESRGHGWLTPFHPEDKPRAEAAWQRAIELQESYSVECRIRRADGEYRWWLIRGAPRCDADGRIQKWFGTCTDIDELKCVEASRRLAHERLQKVMDSITDGLAVLDKEWRYTYVNEQAASIIGMPAEQLLGGCLWELFPGIAGTKFEEGYHRAVATGQRVEIEDFYPEPINKWLECYCYPSNEGLSVYFHDVTARKHVEESRRQNEALFSKLIEQAPMGVYVVDAEFRLQQVNSLAAPVFAVVRPLIGRDFTEVMETLWGAELGSEIANIFRHTLDTGERYVSPSFVHPRADLGVEQAFDWEAQRVALPDGRHGLVCYFTDVTEQRRAEAALLAAKEAAEAANRSKDHFLAALSHELRTPLTPVLMAVGALETDPELKPQVREDLAMIKRNVELETKLIDDLLDLSRITSGKLEVKSETVALNDAVRQVCGICRSQLEEENVRLEIDLSPEAGLITADPARLQQVLWNVLKNAVKFTSAQGVVRVTTARLGPDLCEVRVQDSGIGIPPERLPRIFEAFEQGDAQVTRQFGGLGLGLAISRALIKMQNGTIRAESFGEGQGATFIIEVVGRASALIDSRPAPVAGDGDKGVMPRLLLVDDHADTARLLSALLRAHGFSIRFASDVASAVALLEREPIDVLVSDLGLPDGSGYEIMHAAKKKGNIIGIAMSGYGMEDDLRRSQAEGFSEHLIKPFEIPSLIAAIHRLMEKR